MINNANRAAACLVEYNNKIRSGEKNFKPLQEMTKHMAKENRKNDAESSAEEEDDEYD